MNKKDGGWGKAIAVGAAIGIAAGLAKVGYDAQKEVNEENKTLRRKSTKELLKDQMVVDVLSGKDIKEWFQTETQGNLSGKTLLVAKATPKTLEGILFVEDDLLDPEHYLLLAIMSQEQEEILKLQLVNYDHLSEALEKKLDENDGYVVLEEGI